MSRNFDLMHDMERYHEIVPIQPVKPTIARRKRKRSRTNSRSRSTKEV